MRQTKWKTKNQQLKVGDIVLLVDTGVARGKWNMARIIEVYPGRDVQKKREGQNQVWRIQTFSTEVLPDLRRISLTVALEGCYRQSEGIIYLYH